MKVYRYEFEAWLYGMLKTDGPQGGIAEWVIRNNSVWSNIPSLCRDSGYQSGGKAEASASLKIKVVFLRVGQDFRAGKIPIKTVLNSRYTKIFTAHLTERLLCGGSGGKRAQYENKDQRDTYCFRI